jgi:MFS family permease
MFVLYGIIGLLCAAISANMPEETGSTETGTANKARSAPLKKSRKIVYTLAALFSLDAFGGGFVVQAMLALWLFQKFQLSISMAGTIFFWTGIFSALSYLAAIRIANRFGLINTMVFTHLPANILLILIPFMPTLGWAIALLLIRSGLSQMDVPARSSYVMAIVPPAERAAAASMTSVPRSLASAAGPFLAGYLLSISSFGWPLVIAGGLKIIYDLLLLRMFRTVKPPEEGHPNDQENL